MLSQIGLFFSVTKLKSPGGEPFTIATQGIYLRSPGASITCSFSQALTFPEKGIYTMCVSG